MFELRWLRGRSGQSARRQVCVFLFTLFASSPTVGAPKPFYVKFEGKLRGSTETFEGRILVGEISWQDVWVSTSNGTRCAGTLLPRSPRWRSERGSADNLSHTYLACTDGRQGALEVRDWGPQFIWRGDIGGREFIFAFPDHPNQQSRLGPSDFKDSPLNPSELPESFHRLWPAPRR